MSRKIELKNGLKVILNFMPRMESASIGIWISTGSRNEDVRLSGASHFLEHMVFKGTPTRTSRQIKEEIEGKGGSLNGFTSEEVTCYLAKVSKLHIHTALNVLSDIVINASLRKSDMDKERTVIMEEIKMYQDLPNQHVYDVLSELMWPDHPLGLSVAGSIASVASITRKNLLEYKSANYIPKKIVLVICGNFGRDDVIKEIENIFNFNVDKEIFPFTRYNGTQTAPQVKILQKKLAQSHLLLGLRSFGRMHRDRYILSLLHIILGANMSSRLFESVREKKGLAYEIGTEIKRYFDTGAFLVKVGTEHKKVLEAVALVIKELTRIKTREVKSDELKRAKEFFKVQLLLALEDTLEHMLWLGEHVMSSGRLPQKNDIIKKIDSISAGDLQRVAKWIFKPENINLALIGPMRDNEIKTLGKELEKV